jgi:hypothetical protein
MKKIGTILLILGLVTSSFAATTVLKVIDKIQATGGTQLAVPTVGGAVLSDTSTVSVTNKTMSGASNTFSAIPVGAIGNGSVLSGSNTGDVTAAAFGSTPNANGLSLSGQVLNLQPADATHPGGLSTADWNTFNGKLSSPALNGGSGSAESVSAAGGVTLTSIVILNEVWVVGNGGAVTVTATPSITVCTADGQQLKVHGTDNTNTVTLQDEAGLSGSKLELNGNATLGLNQTLTLHCDITQGRWIEDSRTN